MRSPSRAESRSRAERPVAVREFVTAGRSTARLLRGQKGEAVKYDEFIATVRERGEYADRHEAEQVTRAVLGVLGERLAGGEPKDLAAQLPEELQDSLLEVPGAAAFGVEEFLRRVAERLPATNETARWDASAVLSTVADAVSGGQLNQVLSQLPSGYAELFGKPELA